MAHKQFAPKRNRKLVAVANRAHRDDQPQERVRDGRIRLAHYGIVDGRRED